MSDYYCTNCGADLGDQEGFDPDKDFWRCKECGEELYGDDSVDDPSNRFPGVVWHCDGCDAVLNNQFGFDDWLSSFTCTKCGTCNRIEEDEIRKESALGVVADFFDSVSRLVETVGEIGGLSANEIDEEEAEGDQKRSPCKPVSKKPSALKEGFSMLAPVLAFVCLFVVFVAAAQFPDEALSLLKWVIDLLLVALTYLKECLFQFFSFIADFIQQQL